MTPEDPGLVFDMPSGTTADQPTVGGKKVDFLFVLDSSISMEVHSQKLLQSLPGFLTAIEARADAGDYNDFRIAELFAATTKPSRTGASGFRVGAGAC